MNHATPLLLPATETKTVVVLALSIAAMVVSMMQTLPIPILGLIQKDLDASVSNISWVTTATLLSAAGLHPTPRPIRRPARQEADPGGRARRHGRRIRDRRPRPDPAPADSRPRSSRAPPPRSSHWPCRYCAKRSDRTSFPEQWHWSAAPSLSAAASPSSPPDCSPRAPTLTIATPSGWPPPSPSSPWPQSSSWSPATRQKTGGRTDLLGALSLGITLLLLLLAISQGNEWGWTSGRTLGASTGAVGMAAVWVLVELKVHEPLVDMRMFTHRPVLMANLAGILVGFGMFANFLGISYLVQMPKSLTGYGFDASILRASVEFLLPGAIISLLASPLGGRLVWHRGPRVVLGLAAVLGARRIRVARPRPLPHRLGNRCGPDRRRGRQLRLRSDARRHHGECSAPSERHRQRHQLDLPLYWQRNR